MGRFIVSNTKRKIEKVNDSFWEMVMKQAIASGGSIVVFLPNDKKLLVK